MRHAYSLDSVDKQGSSVRSILEAELEIRKEKGLDTKLIESQLNYDCHDDYIDLFNFILFFRPNLLQNLRHYLDNECAYLPNLEFYMRCEYIIESEIDRLKEKRKDAR